MIRRQLNTFLYVDPAAKTVEIVMTIHAAQAAEGEVEVFRQDITRALSADQKRRLRHLLNR